MRPAFLVVAVALVAPLLAACGSDKPSALTPTGAVVRTIATGELAQNGRLRTCVDLHSPPFAFVRDGRKTGFEVELLERMARRLALRVVWLPMPRTQFATALKARRCDVIVSRLGYDLDTQFSLDVGAFQYMALPLTLVVPAGSPSAPLAIADLCGRHLAVVAWTAPAFDAIEQQQTCRRSAKPGLRLTQVQSSEQGLGLLRSGRAQALLDDAVSVASLLSGRHDFETAEITDKKGYIALGYREYRLSTEAGLHAALLTLYDDGAVDELVKRWHLDGKVTLLPLP